MTSNLYVHKTFVSVLSCFRLHPNNVLGIRNFADQFMCSNLVEESNKYIQKLFIEVSKSEEFLTLSSQDVLEILERDELYVTNEEQVRCKAKGVQ